MSTWTKQNLFELGTVARGKSKHRPRQHPATPRSQLCYTIVVSHMGLYRDSAATDDSVDE